jgi:hypothetical protein
MIVLRPADANAAGHDAAARLAGPAAALVPSRAARPQGRITLAGVIAAMGPSATAAGVCGTAAALLLPRRAGEGAG